MASRVCFPSPPPHLCLAPPMPLCPCVEGGQNTKNLGGKDEVQPSPPGVFGPTAIGRGGVLSSHLCPACSPFRPLPQEHNNLCLAAEGRVSPVLNGGVGWGGGVCGLLPKALWEYKGKPDGVVETHPALLVRNPASLLVSLHHAQLTLFSLSSSPFHRPHPQARRLSVVCGQQRLIHLPLCTARATPPKGERTTRGGVPVPFKSNQQQLILLRRRKRRQGAAAAAPAAAAADASSLWPLPRGRQPSHAAHLPQQ